MMSGIETSRFNCTTCPSECMLTLEIEHDGGDTGPVIRSITGNRCPRGKTFATQELTRPLRVLTTTVVVRDGEELLVPVRTAEAIPRDLHTRGMELARGLIVEAPLLMGDVIVPNMLKTGVDLIASMDVAREQCPKTR